MKGFNIYQLVDATDASVKEIKESLINKKYDANLDLENITKSYRNNKILIPIKKEINELKRYKFLFKGDSLQILTIKRLRDINENYSKYFNDKEEYNQFLDRVFLSSYNLSGDIEYSIEEKKVTVKITDIFDSLDKRTYFWRHSFLKNHGLPHMEPYSVKDAEENFKSYIYDMGKLLAYANHYDKSLKEAFNNEDLSGAYEDKFLEWYIKAQGISERQLRCDHDRQDGWTADGYWVNSFSECLKCGLSEEVDLDEIDDIIYEAWKAGRDSLQEE